MTYAMLKYQGVTFYIQGFKQNYLVLRGVIGSTFTILYFFALQWLSLSECNVLTALAPIFTGILGKIILRENYGLMQVLFSAMGFFGVILISNPEIILGAAASSEE